MPERRANRLAGETSPYLLQHQFNPVDWHPWGPEALELARERDVPIFLSIGYAACHWCHVMERESFEHDGIAAYLAEHFVSIKVDREERPDIDEIYMQAVQLLSGQGGWPMSMFLTPDGRPFFGGTYYPPEDRWGHPGFGSVLRHISTGWSQQREQIEEAADRLQAVLREGLEKSRGEPAPATAALVAEAVQRLDGRFDPVWGGFSGAPKFPHADAVSLALRHASRTGNDSVSRMALHTLAAMERGGIHDQIGGGFHRYSTDARWLVPHFEKMLYDQALLGKAYLDAFAWNGDMRWARVVRGICDWVLRDMVLEGGGIASTLDADSEGEEGKFYVWTPEEFAAALKEGGFEPDELERIARWYRIEGEPNFEGAWIPHRLEESEAEVLADVEPDRHWDLVDRANRCLRTWREKREWPAKDDKVLAAWNGLMVGTLARAGADLEESRYLDAAVSAARFVLDSMQPEGRLMRSYREGRLNCLGYLEDYAFLADGLLELHRATSEQTWLDQAERLAGETFRLFWDERDGGFFFTGNDAEELLVRSKASHDGATPAGASVMANVLVRLWELTSKDRYLERAKQTLALQTHAMETMPGAYSTLLQALELLAADGLLDAGEAGAKASGPVTESPPGLRVEATATSDSDRSLKATVKLSLDPGFHVPANPAGGGSTPTEVRLGDSAGGWKIEEIAYPAPTSKDPEPIWEGAVTIQLTIGAVEAPPVPPVEIPMRLRYQMCGEGQCWPPTEHSFTLPWKEKG